MFICNFKINGKKVWRTTLVLLIILIIALMLFVCSRIFGSNKDNNSNNEIIEITSDSYTSFLQDSHENMNSYINKNVKISGYVYRLPDFTSNQFVIARTMIIDNKTQAVVVGMLAQCTSSEKYESGSWVEVTGSIKVGNYNGEIPILEISNIKSIKAPESEFVYPPKN